MYIIIVGGEELLSCDENRKYTVKGNTSGYTLGVCVHYWGIGVASGMVPDVSKLCLTCT